MIIIDNFTSENHQDEIEKALNNTSSFAWYYNDGTNPKDGKGTYKNLNNVVDPIQFTHTFKEWENTRSNYYNLIYPLIVIAEKEFNLKLSNKVIRIKSNLLLRDNSIPEGSYHYPHVDYIAENDNVEYRSLLYYVSDSDGDTVIFNEKDVDAATLSESKRITPKKGRAVFFDSSYLHCSTSPVQYDKRVVINFVFELLPV